MVIPTEDVICFAAGDIEWMGHGTSQAPYPTEMLDLLRVGVICIGMIRVVEGADPTIRFICFAYRHITSAHIIIGLFFQFGK